jgi:7-cyano-7-deazaguanine synthase in queuosine biosynthesis
MVDLLTPILSAMINMVSLLLADNNGDACGFCDACEYRKLGFKEAGVPDPTRYQK